jgi:hypothetical protein
MPDPARLRIVDGMQVAEAARATLQDFLIDHIAEIERQRGLPPQTIAAPMNWSFVLDLRRAADEANLPRVMVECAGLDGRPERGGEGFWRAPWALVVSAVVSARDDESTERLARRYAAAIRDCLLSHRTLGGVAETVRWTDEQYDPLGSDDTQAIASGSVAFTVWVEDVACDTAEQLPPAYQPPGPATTTQTVITHVNRTEEP